MRNRRRPIDGPLLAIVLTAFLLLATVYNGYSTPFEAPDEVGHFYYIVHLLQARRLPIVPATGPEPNYEHEGAQPPLYYLSAAALVRALERIVPLSLDDVGASLGVNPHSTCGQPGSRYNVAYFERDLHQERFPHGGRVRVLRLVRLWSSLLATAAVGGIFATARLAFPGSPWTAWLATGLAATTPDFLFTAGAASNDNLVVALVTWGVYLGMRALRDGLSWPHAILLGLLAGMATLSKVSGALLLPLFVMVAVATVYRRHTSSPYPRRSSQSLLLALLCGLILVSFLAVTGWWLLRNLRLYGDLTGTSPIVLDERQGMSLSVLIRELVGVFRSWWGAFGCTAPAVIFPLPYAIVVATGIAGFAAARVMCGPKRWQVGLLLAWFGFVFLAFFRWNWLTYAPHGRLLFPGMVSVAVLLGRGLAYWSERWRWFGPLLLALLALGAVAVPFAVMAPPSSHPIIYSDPTEVTIAHQLDGRFGASIALLGYDISGTSFQPGETLGINLYWHVIDRPPENYSLAIQLVSAEPGATATLVNFNTWTGGGNYPTGKWHAGDVILDRYELAIPPQIERAGGWYLQVVLFSTADGARLPFTLNGHPAGDTAKLSLLRVGTSEAGVDEPGEDARLARPVTFGEVFALDGVAVSRENAHLHVTLWWRGLESTADDYSAFVHLYGADGLLVDTADGPPLAGGFPTSLWEPGDRVRDERVLELPDAPGSLEVGVGWYQPLTGARLEATDAGGEALPDDVFLIPFSAQGREGRVSIDGAACSGPTSN